VINTNANTNASNLIATKSTTTIANVIDIDVINERTSTINIDENDMNVINTNVNINATNSIATKNTTTITNAINTNAINKQRNTINIDEK
jgi:putative ubiquitin-RnfH superfamily antitoxin RatB of RatAB toxin-antitoxin module